MQLADGTTAYKVEKWTPVGGQRGQETKEVVSVSAVDLLEREMEEEYEHIVVKDK